MSARVRYFVGDARRRGARRTTTAAWPTAMACSRRCARIAASVPWWDAHWQRLQRGARALRHRRCPTRRCVAREATRCSTARDARAQAASSPAAAAGAATRRRPTPTPHLDRCRRIRCRPRAAAGPAPALVRHAPGAAAGAGRASSTATASSRCWRAPSGATRPSHEGLMCSSEGDVVCATAANLFVLRDGALADARWSTAAASPASAGPGRSAALPAREARLAVTDVEAADAVFLCNAVRGILPVARLGARAWRPHPQVVALQRPPGRRASRFRHGGFVSRKSRDAGRFGRHFRWLSAAVAADRRRRRLLAVAALHRASPTRRWRASRRARRVVVERGDSLPTRACASCARPACATGDLLEWRALARQLRRRRQAAGRRVRAGAGHVAARAADRDARRQGRSSHRFTIVEGWNIRELRAALAQGHAARSRKPRKLDDAALMKALGAPGQHPEGRFLPETYLYTRGDSDLDVLKRAHEAMDKALAAAWEQRAPDTRAQDAGRDADAGVDRREGNRRRRRSGRRSPACSRAGSRSACACRPIRP